MGIYFMSGVGSQQCPPEEDSNKVRTILLCRVCVGDTDNVQKGGNRQGIRKPNINSTTNKPFHSHTSLDTGEIVIFDNHQAYIEYIIKFKGDMV
jgi:hypothetical protein